MAAETIIEQVRTDYLAATDWLQHSLLQAWPRPLAGASHYLTDRYLRRYQRMITQSQVQRPYCFMGVLRCDHHVLVRILPDDERTCIVIDTQTQRRMATYVYRTRERLHTQHLPDAAVVYQMLYDDRAGSWKIALLVQELPLGWENKRILHEMQTVPDFPALFGRNN